MVLGMATQIDRCHHDDGHHHLNDEMNWKKWGEKKNEKKLEKKKK